MRAFKMAKKYREPFPPYWPQKFIQRTTDDACIPEDHRNADWKEYQEWLAAGNMPEPYVEKK